jgi:hypothetical protein
MYNKSKLILICNEIFDFLQNKESKQLSISGTGMKTTNLSKEGKKELVGNIKVGKKYSISYSWDGDNTIVSLIRENSFILTGKGNTIYDKAIQPSHLGIASHTTIDFV